MPGFCARRQGSAVVTFALRYRGPDGKDRWLKIGRFGALTVEEARRLAKQAAGEIAAGADPQAEKAARRAEAAARLTVAELVEAYIAAAEAETVLTRFGRPKRPSSLAVDRGTLRRHVVPILGAVAARELTAAQVAGFVAKVTAGATAIDERTGPRGRARVKGGAGTAARTCNVLGGVYTWGRQQGLVEHDPVRGVQRAKARVRERVLSPAELAALGRVLDRGTDADGRAFNPMALAILRLLALTGARRGEIEGLSWSEVDAAGRCLRLRDTKTGASTRPLGAPARAILAALPRLDDLRVFPAGRGAAGGFGARQEIARMMSAAGIADASAHSLRRTFVTVGAEIGLSEPVIAALVGHSRRTVTSRYAHAPDTVLVAAADRVAGEIDRRLRGIAEPGEGAEIVALPAARRA